MSTQPAPKRKRVASTVTQVTDSTPVDPSVLDAVDVLNDAIVRELLLDIVVEHPATRAMVLARLQLEQDKERARVLNFDGCSKSVWHAINKRHSRLSGSRQYDVAYEVEAEVRDTIKTIANQVQPHSSFGTKRSALETLRKIGKTICLSDDDVVGHEVQQSFQDAADFEEATESVLECMDGEEERRMREDDHGEFVRKMEELVGLAENACVFEGIGEVLEVLLDGVLEDDDNEDGGEEGDEEDEGADDLPEPANAPINIT